MLKNPGFAPGAAASGTPGPLGIQVRLEPVLFPGTPRIRHH